MPKHRQTEEQRPGKSSNIEEHYKEIGISSVRASVRYVLTDSSAVLTDTDRTDTDRKKPAVRDKRVRD
jgi:hypothetical protein